VWQSMQTSNEGEAIIHDARLNALELTGPCLRSPESPRTNILHVLATVLRTQTNMPAENASYHAVMIEDVSRLEYMTAAVPAKELMLMIAV